LHFIRDGERDLALEVEMLLAADPQRAGQAARGGGDALCRLAAQEVVTRQHLAAVGKALVDGDDGVLRRDLDEAEAGGPAGLGAGLGDDGEHHLAVEGNPGVGEDRIVAHGGAAVVVAGNVGGGENGDDAGRGAHLLEIEPGDDAARRRRIAGRDMDGARGLALVVDVEGPAADMARGAVVGKRGARRPRWGVRRRDRSPAA
jgi:hypothetical protein